VTATLVPGASVVVSAERAATVSITGLKTFGSQTYAGQYVARVALKAGHKKTLTIVP
jgi:hypothetical protein